MDKLAIEIIAICDELGLTANTEIAASKNTFLSAWHKKKADVDISNT